MTNDPSSDALLALQKHVQSVESKLATASEELMITEASYRRLFENAPLGIISMDATGQILDANPVMIEILGSPSVEVTRKINVLTFPPLIASGVVDNLLRCMRERRTIVCEHPYTTAFGRDVHLRYYLTPVIGPNDIMQGVQAIVEDRAEARRAEAAERRFRETMEQASKMESVATLARGVGHDMSTILGTILGFASNLKLQSDPLDHTQMDIKGIIQACRQGRELMRGLSEASRLDPADPYPVDLHAVIQHCAEVLERTTPATLEIDVVTGAELSVVLGDPRALHHALMNVCLNGVEAMGGAGRLLIETLNVSDEAGDGAMIRVRLTDTGPGMSAEVARRAFDPFFTTKERSEGRGLGLTLTYNTIHSHGGGVRLDGTDAGTTVTLDLPAVRGAEVPASAEGRSGTFEKPGKGEAVLLIDGDGLGQVAARRLLRSLGYKVLVSDEGPLAVEIFSSLVQEIRVVIVDASLHDVGGRSLLDALREINPDCPVIMATVEGDTRTWEGAVGVLYKPFGARALAGALTSALNA